MLPVVRRFHQQSLFLIDYSVMIHYHGTPCGGSRQDVARFLVGRHALIPFARPDDLPIALEVCQSVCLDNSAFTYWKAGKGDVDFDGYHSWVQSLAGHPRLDWCLIPDKIDGTEQQNVNLVTKWLRVGSKVIGVPVWHLHESLEWLEYLVNNFQRVALGSSGQWATPGTDGWWRRIESVMSVACDTMGKPKARLHGLRMLDPRIFQHIPLSSADSTNATMNAGIIKVFGQYPPATQYQRLAVIADRIESNSSAACWDGKQNDLFALMQT